VLLSGRVVKAPSSFAASLGEATDSSYPDLVFLRALRARGVRPLRGVPKTELSLHFSTWDKPADVSRKPDIFATNSAAFGTK
jgi:hypothetical protein